MSELSAEFGKKECPLPEWAVWVKFKTSGYPFSLRRRWAETHDDKKILEIILGYVVDWNLPDLTGKVIPLPKDKRPASLLDEVEDVLIVWLIRAFREFWQIELSAPRKNLLPPSPAS